MDDSPTDFSALERELNGCIQAEERYWQQNDAKFRAVEQKVASYEEFRQMVMAAHLKPMDKTDRIEDPSSKFVIWNTVARLKNACNNKMPLKLVELETKQSDDTRPITTGEFLKQWRSSNQLDRLKLLKNIQNHHFQKLFDVDIPMGFLSEVFELFLLAEINKFDIIFIVSVLETLSKSKRFHLNLQFLNSSERNIGGELFNKLINSFQNWNEELAKEGLPEERILEVKTKYQM